MLLLLLLLLRCVPRMISGVQMAHRLDTLTRLLWQYNEISDKFISRLLTVDETWFHHFDAERKNVKYDLETCNFSQSLPLR